MFITIQCDTGVIFNGNRIRCLIVLGNPVFNALDMFDLDGGDDMVDVENDLGVDIADLDDENL